MSLGAGAGKRVGHMQSLFQKQIATGGPYGVPQTLIGPGNNSNRLDWVAQRDISTDVQGIVASKQPGRLKLSLQSEDQAVIVLIVPSS